MTEITTIRRMFLVFDQNEKYHFCRLGAVAFDVRLPIDP
jgi:hypothetical protein